AERYTDNILMSIGTIRSGMEDAQSGADQLSTGTKTLQSGLDTLAQGTSSAASGSAQLADGANSAAQGASQAADGSSALATGIGRLEAGASTLSTGITQYTAGVDQAAAGAGTLAGGVTTYTTGVDSAAAGARQLASGAAGLTTLSQGVTQYTAGVDQLRSSVVTGQGSTPSLVAGAAALVGDGSAKTPGLTGLAQGAHDLHGTLTSEESQAQLAALSKGSTDLSSGVTAYTGGVDQLAASQACTGPAAHADPALAAVCQNLAGLSQQSQALRAGAAGLDSGINGDGDSSSGLLGSMKDITGAVGQLDQGSQTALTGANTLAAGVGTSTDVYNPSTGTGQTVAGVLNTVSSQSSALREGATRATGLVGGTAQLNSGLSTLASNSPALRSGVATLDSGAQQLASKSSDLRSGATQLSSGTTQAAEGSDTLTLGLRQLSDGTTTLASSTGELATGLGTLDEGAHKAATGTSALSTGIARLSGGLADGADRIPAYTDEDSSHIASVISDPVSVEPVRENAVANNGAGFTPMFMSLALWIGGIAIFLVLPALDRRPSPSERWWMAPLRPAITATVMGIAQAVLLMVLTNGLVGLDASNVGGLVLLAIASSLTFVALNQMLVATLAYRGRFVSIVFLCLQITSMGATFPIETAPRFFQWIHPWLPMSYTQLAFREMLAGAGATHAVRNCLLVLVLYFTVAIALTFLAARLRSGARPLPRDNALLGDSLAAAAEADRANARVRDQLAGGAASESGAGASGPAAATA
ncbi:MAG: YhgE/Pip family protein, partial [Propionibacterium sp.]|nr:YhgE/Pip family protein [Propionibacterium sp.]